MGSAGKWVLGLLLLVVGAVGVARLVSSDGGGSDASVKSFTNTASGSSADAAAAAAAAAKKPSSDVACKKPCIEEPELAKDAVTTEKISPGSITLSKLAFDVPNLNELENEINARKAAEASAKSSAESLAAETAKNDAAITAAAQNGLTAEAAARSAADDKIAKDFAAADAGILSSLNKEIADRSAADDSIQLNLNNEIASRQSALSTLRGELVNGTQVADGSVVLQVNTNEIVGAAVTNAKLAPNAVTTDRIADGTIRGADVTTDDSLALTGANIKNGSLAVDDLGTDSVDTDEIKSGAVKTDEIFDGTIRGSDVTTDNSFALTGANLQNGSVGVADLGTDSVDFDEIVDGSVRSEEIANGTITGTDVTTVDADGLTGSNIKNGTITGGTDAGETVATGDIGVKAVKTGNIDDNAVTAAKVAGDVATQAELDALGTVAPAATNGPAGTKLPNSSDALVEWSRLKGVPGGFADNVDDDGATKVNNFAADLKTGDGSAPNTGDNLVHWENLDGVPTGVLDREALDVQCASTCVSNAEIAGLATSKLTGTITASQLQGGITSALIQDGTITADDLAGSDSGTVVTGAVTSEKIKDGDIQTRDLAGTYAAGVETVVGAVTSEKIADGTIGARDLGADAVDTDELKDGAVISDKVTANVGSAVGGAFPGVTAAQDLATATVALTADAHKVMLTGQVHAACVCATAGDTALVTWTLTDGDGVNPPVAVGPAYSTTLSSSSPMAMLPTSALVTYPSGTAAATHDYKLSATVVPSGAGISVNFTAPVLTAVDLGR